jgi:hypothetical protein
MQAIPNLAADHIRRRKALDATREQPDPKPFCVLCTTEQLGQLATLADKLNAEKFRGWRPRSITLTVTAELNSLGDWEVTLQPEPASEFVSVVKPGVRGTIKRESIREVASFDFVHGLVQVAERE